jgi:murein peptide amidase A
MHRVHDYRSLVARWRSLSREAGLSMNVFAADAGYRLYCVRSPLLAREGGIYISAGIHGDEAAAPEALVVWAERNIRRLRRLPLILFPCVNPWGLVNNNRFDAEGRDLNRVFQHDEVPVVGAMKRLIAGHRFDLALTLHEDYDGQGLYLYEVERTAPHWGEELLEIARPIIAIEGRTTIDRRRSAGGIVRRKVNKRKFPLLPEAVFLHLHHAERTFTIETPSEFSLDARVEAQVAIIEECVRRTAR